MKNAILGFLLFGSMASAQQAQPQSATPSTNPLCKMVAQTYVNLNVDSNNGLGVNGVVFAFQTNQLTSSGAYDGVNLKNGKFVRLNESDLFFTGPGDQHNFVASSRNKNFHDDQNNAQGGLAPFVAGNLETGVTCPADDYFTIKDIDIKVGSLFCIRLVDGKHFGVVRIDALCEVEKAVTYSWIYNPKEGDRFFPAKPRLQKP